MTNPFNAGYFTEHELTGVGFKSIGSNVQIARNATIVGLENIELGDNVRIDPYCSIIAVHGWAFDESYGTGEIYRGNWRERYIR